MRDIDRCSLELSVRLVLLALAAVLAAAVLSVML